MSSVGDQCNRTGDAAIDGFDHNERKIESDANREGMAEVGPVAMAMPMVVMAVAGLTQP